MQKLQADKPQEVVCNIVRKDNGYFVVEGTELYIMNVHSGFGGGNNKYVVFKRVGENVPSEKMCKPTSLQRCKKIAKTLVENPEAKFL